MIAEQQYDVAVVGGGLTGLTVAALTARAGRRVIVFEQSRELGGYARSYTEHDLQFNFGPHALYAAGTAKRLLATLGVPIRGALVEPQGFKGIRDGQLHALPASAASLLTTTLLGWRGRWQMAKLLAGIAQIDPTTLRDVSVAAWLRSVAPDPRAQQVLAALIRVSSYVADTERFSAAVAVRQLQLSIQGSVYYLDGGWQSLVDGLHTQACQAGVAFHRHAKVAALGDDETGKTVHLADGRQYLVGAVVLATSPEVASEILAPMVPALRGAWQGAVPIQMACLNVGLRRLPRPELRVAFGIDRPLYYSVHSAWAKLAPGDEAVIHIGKYLRPGMAPDAAADERELEAVLDLVQPGWRAEVVARRYLPHLLVAHDLLLADKQAVAVQGDPRVPGLEDVYVAGDWVGTDGWLSDRALASAQQAVQLLLQKPASRHVRPTYAVA